MLKDFVEAIALQGVKAHLPIIVKADAEPNGVYYVRQADGTTERVVADPPWREHKAQDLDTVVAFAKRFVEYKDAADAVGPVIWYSRTGVTCVLDDHDRRDTVHMHFGASPQLVHLAEDRKAYTQAEFIRILRITFADCLTACDGLLQCLRSIKFRVHSDGTSKVAQGKASIGKIIDAELTGADALPEYVTFDVPVFGVASLPVRALVRCALEVNPQLETFQLVALPGEVEKATSVGENWVRDAVETALGDAEVPIYYGKP